MRLHYDFHIHSCLSPCGDSDMTPNNIVNMALLAGLDAIALTDHNRIHTDMALTLRHLHHSEYFSPAPLHNFRPDKDYCGSVFHSQSSHRQSRL